MNWSQILEGIDARLVYDNPVFGRETPQAEMDLALIELPNGRHIEVCWDDNGVYSVDLYADKFAVHVAGETVATHAEAALVIQELARHAQGPNESTPPDQPPPSPSDPKAMKSPIASPSRQSLPPPSAPHHQIPAG